MGAILYGIDVPPYGGDTMFANQYLAYEALSDGMKRLLARLRAVHSDRKVAGPAGRAERRPSNEGARRRRLARDGEHPSGRPHASGDRAQALFVNKSYTVGFEGMTRPRARAPRLPARARPPAGIHLPLPLGQGVGHLLGQPCVKHLAVNDAGPFRRLMRRVQIAGDKPSEPP